MYIYIMEVALLVIGVVALVVGYRRNHRNLLLTASIALFLGGALGSGIEGFIEGLTESYQQARIGA